MFPVVEATIESAHEVKLLHVKQHIFSLKEWKVQSVSSVLSMGCQCTAVMNGLLFTFVQAMMAGNLTCSQLVSSYIQVRSSSTDNF